MTDSIKRQEELACQAKRGGNHQSGLRGVELTGFRKGSPPGSERLNLNKRRRTTLQITSKQEPTMPLPF